MPDLDWAVLDAAATDIMARAYAPYSRFKVGVAGLMKFVKTLAAVRAGEHSKAADMMLQSKWARQVGDRAIRLAEMMRSPQ